MFGRDADSDIPGINAGSKIMGRGINKAVIVGTLGRDPEIRYSSSGNVTWSSFLIHPETVQNFVST